MSLVRAVGGAVSGTPSDLLIGVSKLLSVPVGKRVVSGMCWTMKLLIEPRVPNGFGFGGLRRILFVMERGGILD